MRHSQQALQSVDDRSGDRVRVRLTLEVDLGTGFPELCDVHDVSATGLLVEARSIPASTNVIVYFPDGSPRSAAVIWSGDTHFGCRFEEPLSMELLAQIKRESPVVWPDFGRRNVDLSAASSTPEESVRGATELLKKHFVQPETALDEERRMSPRSSLLVIAASAAVSWVVVAACISPLL